MNVNFILIYIFCFVFYIRIPYYSLFYRHFLLTISNLSLFCFSCCVIMNKINCQNGDLYERLEEMALRT